MNEDLTIQLEYFSLDETNKVALTIVAATCENLVAMCQVPRERPEKVTFYPSTIDAPPK
jgi:hypothetical protein